jgi:hypothetical protein
MILFYDNMLYSARGCIEMVVTVAMVTENMCLGRCWKAELVAYGSSKQLSPSFMHLVP